MWTISSDEGQILAGSRRTTQTRVWIANPSGGYTNLCAFLTPPGATNPVNWLDSWEIDSSIDQPTNTATVKILRAVSERLWIVPNFISPANYWSGFQTLTGTLSSGSQTVTMASTLNLAVGNFVSGTGVPPGATITAIVANTSITLSIAATVNGAQSLSFTGNASLLAPGARLYIETMVQPEATAPIYDGSGTGASWKRMFDGYVDSIEWSQHDELVTLTCRDLSLPLNDTWIETENYYGDPTPRAIVGTATNTNPVLAMTSTVGINIGDLAVAGSIPAKSYVTNISGGNVTISNPASANSSGVILFYTPSLVETVMQSIINAWVVSPWAAPTLSTPVSPGWQIAPGFYQAKSDSVLGALSKLAGMIGWDIRYKQSGGSWALQFYNPNRSNSTPNYDFSGVQWDATGLNPQTTGAGRKTIIQLGPLKQSIADIRNVISVVYTDVTSQARATITASLASSISNYGRRWMEIAEQAASQITNATDATTLAQNALLDMQTPLRTASATIDFFWPAELYDVYVFDWPQFLQPFAGGNTTQWSVVAFRHTYDKDKIAQTQLTLRESDSSTGVTGQQGQWLAKATGPGTAPYNSFNVQPSKTVSRVWQGNNQSITQNLATVISFDTKGPLPSVDLNGNYSTSTNRWTCPLVGTYTVQAQVSLGSIAQGVNLEIDILKNGSIWAQEKYSTAAAGTAVMQITVAGAVLAVGDYLQVQVKQGDSTARSTVVFDQFQTWFSIQRFV